jgi:hypothetical protein
LLKPWWLYLAVQTLVTGLLYMSNAYKLLYFGAAMLAAHHATTLLVIDGRRGR